MGVKRVCGRRSILYGMAFVMGFCASVSSAWAAEDPIGVPDGTASTWGDSPVLDEVVVTTSKFDENLVDAPGTVEVITKKDLERRNVKDIDEAVNEAAGVYDRKTKGFADTMPSVNVRGFYGTSRNLILVDGQPVGEHVWRRFPLEMVERIEVVKGPFSALYGSGAMGGVVNVITKKPVSGVAAKVQGDYGTYDTWSSTAVMSGRMKGLFFSGAARKRSTDGYASSLTAKTATASAARPTSGTEVSGWANTTDSVGTAKYLAGDTGENWYNDESYFGKVGYDFSPKTNLFVEYAYTKYDYGYRTGTSYLRDASGNPVTTGTVYFYDSAKGLWERFSLNPVTDFISTYGGNTINMVHGAVESRWGDLKVRGLLGWDKNDYWWVQPSPTAPYIQPSWAKNLRGEFAASHPLPLRQELTAGCEGNSSESSNRTEGLSNWGDRDSLTGNVTARQAGKTHTVGLYLQDKIEVFDALDVYVGARWDHWKVLDGYNYALKGTTALSQTFDASEESFTSPRASVVYKLDEGTRLKGSWGWAFRGPTPSDMYNSWQQASVSLSLANSELNPEKAWSGEVGIEKRVSEKTSVQVTYFHSRMKDYIYTKTFTASEVSDYNAANGTAYTYITQKQNIGTAACDGLELGTRSRLNDWLSAFGNATVLQTKVLENKAVPASVGKQLPSVPGASFNGGFDASWRGFGASLDGRYVGKAFSKDDNSDIYNNVFGSYDPYFVVDAKVSYGRPIGRFEPKLSLACNNLGNLQYFQYYKSPGRTWTVSAEAGF